LIVVLVVRFVVVSEFEFESLNGFESSVTLASVAH
jgi:hypothetical protein